MATEAVNPDGSRRRREDQLARQVYRWPTPTAGDAIGAGNRNLEGSKAHPGTSLTDAILGGQRARQGDTPKLNPTWVEWLMGWPRGWTDLDPLPAGRACIPCAGDAVSELRRWRTLEPAEWWADDPGERVTTRKEHRVQRLRALGNGQVPACVVLAWRLLTEDT